MVADIQKLKGKIIEKNGTQEKIANDIGIDRTTFYRKMRNGGEGFTIGEIHKMVNAIPLSKEEAMEIFFA